MDRNAHADKKVSWLPQVGLREGLTEDAAQSKCGALAVSACCFAGGYITMYLSESTELRTTTKGEYYFMYI